jgi:hypothetical protein
VIRLLAIAALVAGCAVVGDKPDRPSGCCVLLDRGKIEACMRDFLDAPGSCAYATCFPDGLISVGEPDESGDVAEPCKAAP